MPILFENTIIVAYYKVIKVFQCEPEHTWEVRNGLLIDTITGIELIENNTISDTTCIISNNNNNTEDDNEPDYDYPETYKLYAIM